ncbi:MAG: hypothetical protein LC109_01130 [Bacteroidia bacterium]|nr:hypothetical protein [Bacteroidia bacterium]
MKALLNILTGLLMCVLTGGLIAMLFNIEPTIPILGCLGLSLAMGYAGRNQLKEKGILRAGLLREVWLSEMTERFFDDDSFLQDGKDWSPWVENDAINLADIGVAPNVVINRTVYPVPATIRTDGVINLPLTNYSTDSTIHRRIEQIALAYDKRKSIIDDHKSVLVEKIGEHGIYNISPEKNLTKTPVFKTSGGVSGLTGNKIMTSDDIVKMAIAWDNLKYPSVGRTLVVPPDMFWEFVSTNPTIKAQAERNGQGGAGTGVWVEWMGFTIRPRVTTSYYNKTTLIKNAWGAAPTANDKKSAIAYIKQKSFGKALGAMHMFATIDDPDQQGDKINFLTTAIVLPVKQEMLGAIVYSD